MAWLSLRAYAKHRGCALSAVQRAIESGRLTKSVGRDGEGNRKIRDAAAADAEWSATTKDNRVSFAVQARHEAASAPPAAPTPPPADSVDDPVPLAISRARREAAEADIAELDLAERRAELLSVKDVGDRLTNIFGQCKNKLLGVPSRARQQDPGLTVAQLALFETLIRESLEDLAAEADRGPDRVAGAAP